MGVTDRRESASELLWHFPVANKMALGVTNRRVCIEIVKIITYEQTHSSAHPHNQQGNHSPYLCPLDPLLHCALSLLRCQHIYSIDRPQKMCLTLALLLVCEPLHHAKNTVVEFVVANWHINHTIAHDLRGRGREKMKRAMRWENKAVNTHTHTFPEVTCPRVLMRLHTIFTTHKAHTYSITHMSPPAIRYAKRGERERGECDLLFGRFFDECHWHNWRVRMSADVRSPHWGRAGIHLRRVGCHRDLGKFMFGTLIQLYNSLYNWLYSLKNIVFREAGASKSVRTLSFQSAGRGALMSFSFFCGVTHRSHSWRSSHKPTPNPPLPLLYWWLSIPWMERR